jgi:succinate dehydrogenase / fumarate reductase cytochrome b subunit
MHYKWKTGHWAFVLHRVSGVALSVYLIMHIYVVSSLYKPENFDKVMAFLNTPLFKLAEIGLLGAVIYHALNGVRVFMIDYMNATRKHATIFWVLAAFGLVIFLAGAYPFLHHAGIL